MTITRGVYPHTTAAVSVVPIMLFAIFYDASDAVRYRVTPQDANVRSRLSDIPVVFTGGEQKHGDQRSELRRVWDTLGFGFSAYTKLGTGRRIAWEWQSVVIVEWVLGLLTTAVFFYALSNTVPVLQRLRGAVV